MVQMHARRPDVSPFWFENTRESWHNATTLSVERTFQAFNASFRSLGLVFAFSR